ncbi:hypothetical protein D3C81_1931190 [compost metagenome]
MINKEIHEFFYLRAIIRTLFDVDEKRSAQRRVRAIPNRLHSRFYSSATFIYNGNRTQFILIFLKIGQTEVT